MADLSLAVDLQVVTYVTVSFLTLLFYDWIICFNQEEKITRIWMSRWSLIKVLYLIVRYAPFAALIIAVYGAGARTERLAVVCSLMSMNIGIKCPDRPHYRLFLTISILPVFSGAVIGFADLILMLRTYSIYNKSRRILAILALSWIAVAAVCGWAVTKYTHSLNVGHVKDAPNICFLSNEPGLGLVMYISLLAAEIVWKTFDSYLKSNFHFGQVMSMIYCEGLFFYFLIIPFTIGNAAVVLAAPTGYLSLLDSPLTVMHAIFCCRLVLHVREIDALEDEDESDELLPAFIIEVIEPYMSGKGPRYFVPLSCDADAGEVKTQGIVDLTGSERGTAIDNDGLAPEAKRKEI
ncbi:hypothetical protein D9757_013210 [Collybiopsis confluens]|uniref:DUF6533 domain-containing protein n=1 Tax=Collybiopsis confluens TaxID=2823264 RepID=A0A8H5G1K4_9AGAR|nr:hypothetical protein D9757_013210 [Collybiopsis confluens]